MSEPETEAETLDRIEAALTRIAAATASLRRRTGAGPDEPGSEALRAEVAASLDGMIASLRDALGEEPDEQDNTPNSDSNRG